MIAIIVAVAVIEAGHPMANLLVRNVDDEISQALKARASSHGVSAEAEHRRILEEALLRPKRRSFQRVLADMPDVGRDDDFARRQDETARPIFD
jgi:plasmid stability protein